MLGFGGSTLGFTEWLESLTPMVNLVRVLAGLGLVTILLANLKRFAERRCWRKFKVSVHDWVERLIESENRHPNQLSADEWKAECERMLTDANFSPLEINHVLDVAVVVAKGIAADRIIM